MIKEELVRTSYLLGEEGVERLRTKRVAVFGVGGVGGHAVEALARCGVGELDLIDNDTVSLSNINRQIVALHSTVGRAKVEVMAERIADIDPDIRVNCHKTFFLPETADSFDFTKYDYVIDAVDTVTAKLAIIESSKAAGVPVISAMGAGNRLYPTFKVTDVFKTKNCPLAKVMRRELRKRGIESLKVVYSEDEAMKPVYPEGVVDEATGDASEGNQFSGNRGEMTRKDKFPPGSVSFVPSVSGLIIAGEVVRDICEKFLK